VNLYLDDYTARRLGWSLSLLVEWLACTDEAVREELADFGFGLRTEPRRHLAELLTEVETHARVLGSRPPATTGGAA
jgi:hypothetical protein